VKFASAMLIARIVVALAAITSPARADERSLLNACQALVDRATQSVPNAATVAMPANAELQRCRLIIREWTLRDSRMTVDEHGRPLQ
jgi:hypothetical protein